MGKIEGVIRIRMVMEFSVPPGVTPEAFSAALATSIMLPVGLVPHIRETKIDPVSPGPKLVS